jgi:hypothetical protein
MRQDAGFLHTADFASVLMLTGRLRLSGAPDHSQAGITRTNGGRHDHTQREGQGIYSQTVEAPFREHDLAKVTA